MPYQRRALDLAAMEAGPGRGEARRAATRLEGFLRFSDFIACRALARAGLGLMPFLAACGDDSPGKIEDIRERAATTDFKPVSTAERFGFTRSGQQGNPHQGMPAAEEAGFEWTTPAGWEEEPPSQMRAANFRIKRDPQAECYLSVVAGGVAQNANRWRKQMGLEPLAQASLAALPQESLLGQRAFLVDLEGTFVGMGQGEPRPGYRLLGLLLEEPGRTLSLKMTGPAATVAEERERFLELARSFRVAAAPAPSAPEGDDVPAWTAPPEWERRPGSQARVVTFAPRGSTGTECYVTILSGPAGGVEANLNRWREQMGQLRLGPAEFAALETVQVLGRDAKLIEITGNYTDMQGNKVEKAGLLGLVCPLQGAVLFVKMTGPADVITQEKDRFIAFCGSLRAP